MKRLIGILLLAFTGVASADDLFDTMGYRYGVDANLLRAISWQESRWHPWTVNLAGESFYLSSKGEAIELIRESLLNPYMMVVKQGRYKGRRFLMRSSADVMAKAMSLNLAADQFKVTYVKPGRFDAGVMQIHWNAHGKNVPNLDRLMDPDYNVAYGAFFLAKLIRAHGVYKAVAYYHTSTAGPEADRYRNSVLRYYGYLRKKNSGGSDISLNEAGAGHG